MKNAPLRVGDATLRFEVADDLLRSLGPVDVAGTALRNPSNRFLPWFDSYAGDIFRDFRFREVERRGDATIIHTTAISDPDFLFQERRDSSGDLCLRDQTWDADPATGDFRICLEPASAAIEGHAFTGFRYWFEYDATGPKPVPIHRLADRQTWEVGGSLATELGLHIVCRNLFDLPLKKLTREGGYSTVGLQHHIGLMPGNLWARWSLLPAFDMQYGRYGALVAWFDRVSLIRSAIESKPGEDWLRVIDLHGFEQSTSVRTNPKTILFTPDKLDDVDAMNLWTRVYDQEHAKACKQFGVRTQAPPSVTFGENVWQNFRFESTYENVVNTAAEFAADYAFIDPVWEHGEALRKTVHDLVGKEKFKGTALEKYAFANMCCTFDFEVAETHGGEAELKKLVDRAAAKGVKVISWMAIHYHPHTKLAEAPALKHGKSGIFAAKESGHHPDTGYAGHCWTANLNGPIAKKIRDQVLGVCERTGLAGFLWDSFSNLGWWQVDYSDGSMRPQFDHMAALFADLVNAGLYIQPEAVVSFSNASCCGLHGGNVYAGELMGYSYNTVISLHYTDPVDNVGGDQLSRVLTGERPIELLFECLAHKRVPGFEFHRVPRETWKAERAAEIKALVQAYKRVRGWMDRRTVLKGGAGVRWDSDAGPSVFYSFKKQAPAWKGEWRGLDEKPVATLEQSRIYLVR
ncbi:MAG: hypothetical protein NTW19_03060 [Planctomycetota bacterium]|nr:hypothetical protein [Planctomycetota bacterium]